MNAFLEIQDVLNARSFRPFWIVASDGFRIPVVDQEQVFLAKLDDSVIITKYGGGLHIIDRESITRIETVKSAEEIQDIMQASGKISSESMQDILKQIGKPG